LLLSNYFFLTVLGVSSSCCIWAQEPTIEAPPTASQITDNKTGKIVSVAELVDSVSSCEVIFLGEQHDNDSGHAFQLEVLQKLSEKGLDLVLSTEQFERDVQGPLNDYLADRITEEQFLAASRPWKNYPEHYRAMVEFAKQKKMPVLAANLPRSLAASLSNKQPLRTHEQVFAARSTTAPEDRYWLNFLDSMKGHVGVDGTDQLKSFYVSQCAKDDAMAEAITDFLAVNRHRPKTVVHLCGHFHSDYGLGTAGRVLQRNPLARLAIVTMEATPKNGKLKTDTMYERAHFTLWTIENAAKPEAAAK
jgi:uncharacterized iron-regulated protein